MKITIITAAYNSASTIADAIESVRSQSYPEIEHIVADGCSTDDTCSIVERHRHPGLRLFSEPDGGIYDALNKAIARSTGDVVGLVHSDDFLAHSQVLETVARAFEDPSVEAVYGDLTYVAKDNPARVIRYWRAGEFKRRKLRYGWMPPHPSLYLRSSVFDRMGCYDTRYRIAADYDFILRYFKDVRVQPVYIPEVLLVMRVGGASNGNLSGIIRKMGEDYASIKRNGIGGIEVLLAKNLSKAGQLLPLGR